MDSYHHQHQQWQYLSPPHSGPFHGLHIPTFSAEHAPSPDTHLQVSARLSRKRSASAAVSLGHPNNSDYDKPSPANISEGHDVRSPVDGSSTSGAEDSLANATTTSSTSSAPSSATATIPAFGKPPTTNNFVTKLYQSVVFLTFYSVSYVRPSGWSMTQRLPNLLSGQTSARLSSSPISASSVGPFLGPISSTTMWVSSAASWPLHPHLPQFSSFVRQLNMYGFHKINRVRIFCLATAHALHTHLDSSCPAHVHQRSGLGVFSPQVSPWPPWSSRSYQTKSTRTRSCHQAPRGTPRRGKSPW